MENMELLEKTKKALRSVLISAPRGVPVRLLVGDFRMVLGYELPYRQLGFNNLDAFVHSIPDVVRLGSGLQGEPTYFAVADSKTSQILRFVASQRKPKIKKAHIPPSARKPVTGFTNKPLFSPMSGKQRPQKRGKGSPSGKWTGGGGGGHSGGGSVQCNKMRSVGPPTHKQPPKILNPKPLPRVGNSGGDQPQPFYRGRDGGGTSRGEEQKQLSRSNGHVLSDREQKKGTGSYSSKQWNPKVMKCSSMKTITELGEIAAQRRPFPHVVGLEGYIVSDGYLENSCLTFKYHMKMNCNEKSGIALCLCFSHAIWKTMDECVDFRHIPRGSKLRVYGNPSVLSKKPFPELNLTVMHYSYESSPNVSSSVSHGGSISNQSSPSSIPSPLPSDMENLPLLIHQLLAKKTGGVWGMRLGNEFEAFHKMEAPKDILKIALALEFVETEICGDNPILRLVVGNSEMSAAGEGSSKQEVVSSPVGQVGKSSVSLTTKKPPIPATMEFGSAEKYFDVFVTYISSPTSFYLQHTGEGYAKQLQTMHNSMSEHLSRNRIRPVNAISINGLYGYRWVSEEEDEEVETWCRALVSELLPASPGHKESVVVYFPDFGNSIEVNPEDLMDLPSEYYQLPFQAIHCCLHGCVNGSHDEVTQIFVKAALDKDCVAQIMNNSAGRVSVELIDSETGDGNINSLIMFAMYPLATLAPKLPQPGDPRVPIILTDVDADGIVTVQLRGPGLVRLQELMTLINKTYKKSKAADFVPSAVEGEVYCGLDSIDKKFFRVQLKKVLPNQELLVEYVDYGNSSVTKKTKLRKPFPDKLFKLPFQAVRCKLHGIPVTKGQWSESAQLFISSYLDNEEDLYLTVMEPGVVSECKLPVVKIMVSEGREDEEVDLILNEVIPWDSSDMVQAGNGERDIPSTNSNSSASLDTGLANLTLSLDYRLQECSVGYKFDSDKPTLFNMDVQLKQDSSTVETLLSPALEPGLAVELSCLRGDTNGTGVDTDRSSSCSTSCGRNTPLSTPTACSSLSLNESSQSVGCVTSWASSSASGGAVYHNIAGGSCVPPKTPTTCGTPTCSMPTSQYADGSERLDLCASGLVSDSYSGTVLSSGAKKDLHFAQLISDSENGFVPVLVPWVKSPHQFVVQQLSRMEALLALESELSNTLFHSSEKYQPSTSLFVGQLCSSPSSLDKGWYRGLIVALSTCGQAASVEFLDYGNTEEVPISRLRPLPSEFCQFPFQGIACALFGIEPSAKVWSTMEESWFVNCVLDNRFYAVELSRSKGRSYITLFDTSGKVGVDIRDSIKEAFPSKKYTD